VNRDRPHGPSHRTRQRKIRSAERLPAASTPRSGAVLRVSLPTGGGHGVHGTMRAGRGARARRRRKMSLAEGWPREWLTEQNSIPCDSCRGDHRKGEAEECGGGAGRPHGAHTGPVRRIGSRTAVNARALAYLPRRTDELAIRNSTCERRRTSTAGGDRKVRRLLPEDIPPRGRYPLPCHAMQRGL
jgi:hypothetical protein